MRTAFDLARWAPNLIEKVVAVDALAYRHRFTAHQVREMAREHFGAGGSKDLPRVLRLVDARSESPMESRIRLVLVLGACRRRPSSTRWPGTVDPSGWIWPTPRSGWPSSTTAASTGSRRELAGTWSAKRY